MYCSKCGTLISDDNDFCANCGAKILKETTESENTNTTSAAPTATSNSKKKTFITVVICIAALFCIWLIINHVGKTNLKKQLMRDWSRTESEDGTYYTLELDFSEDEIEYTFDSFYYDSTIATYDYEVISGNKIKLDNSDTIYTIEFDDDKTMMTVSPAITSIDSYEHWFHH